MESTDIYLVKAQKRAEEFYRLTSRYVTPCTLGEIKELEQSRKHRFPEAYRAFLLWMGRSGGEFLAGSDCFYKSLKGLQKDAQELLKDNNFPGKLPEDAFVFFMHQGYQFYFFRLGDGADPPVYGYHEENPVWISFSQPYVHFSDFVLGEMEKHIVIKRKIDS